MSEPTGGVVELDHVTKTYDGGVTALDDVSLTVADGDLLAVVGASGSGKSTLLHLMGTLDRPTSGTVRVAGERVDTLGDRALSVLRARRIGFVFQQSHLADRQAAVRNVETGLLYAGVPRRRRETLALEALDRVGLAHRAGHLPHQLSGGERQRVGIARALVTSPAVVLADEPTGALDSVTGAAVVDLFRALNATGVTIVVITHDQELAASLPRRVTLRDGRVVADERAVAVGGAKEADR
ncbi:ABC transporter ATP-binding protein [Promicromonospora thailandica]|uniref:ABC transport system ATP-binding protein n=1 Tax=Promicromonospora thailandica TaxID=765201 RepID=A0A9X2FZN9_9MICO|nr:ABC transporter ATP-binding protein [Promicromonospora thailandica]MCP2264367.1 putative ABC transport system ATP-binding protein [Promicromonospora thailandica]BFF20940.1 ABC transporter ATP-binding protein [Promicromonospora thailandica]